MSDLPWIKWEGGECPVPYADWVAVCTTEHPDKHWGGAAVFNWKNVTRYYVSDKDGNPICSRVASELRPTRYTGTTQRDHIEDVRRLHDAGRVPGRYDFYHCQILQKVRQKR